MQSLLRFTCFIVIGGYLAGVVTAQSAGGNPPAEEASAARPAPRISSLELARWLDERLAAHWEAAGWSAPGVVDDATYMRRVYLDLIGAIPSVPQVRDFLYASGTYKREDLVDRLLRDDRRPERYASRSAGHLARIWRRAMIPANSPGIAAATGLDPWLREQLYTNVAYDEFARRLITATPPADMRNAQTPAPADSVQVYYQAIGGNPVNSANQLTRYFLGVRLGCAQCHPHPFSHWKQDDFWGIAAFFGEDAANGVPSIQDESGQAYPAKLLWDGPPTITANESPRATLARWMTSPENRNFSASAVNRIWQHLCGQGITGVVDDLDQVGDEERAVLDELGQLFAESDFNVRWLIEGICKSQFYQRISLSAESDEHTVGTLRPLKTLSPEQVFDSLEEALALPVGRLDNPPRYNGLKDAFVARMNEAASESPDDFRAGIPQALMIMNGKLTADATSLEKSRTLRAIVEAPFMEAEEKLETLFLATLTRAPTEQELDFLLQHIGQQTNDTARGRAYGEVLWGLLNSPEFVLSR